MNFVDARTYSYIYITAIPSMAWGSIKKDGEKD